MAEQVDEDGHHTYARFWLQYMARPVELEGNAYDKQKQWSQEIRLASNGERTIDYVVGLYYFRQRIPATR